jgi:hypothetical protein
MSRVTMPVLVRLLMCAALFAVLGASTTPSNQWSHEGSNSAAEHLPTTNSFSGYIIAVG